ncbi:MAG: DUF4384 domain-containing protein [Granulosicoccus sp.]
MSISRVCVFLCIVTLWGCVSGRDARQTGSDEIRKIAPLKAAAVKSSPTDLSAIIPDQTNTNTPALLNSLPSPDSWSDIGTASALSLRAQTKGGKHLSVGDPIQIIVETDQDSQIHCYYQDGDGTVSRLFPNRYSADGILNAGDALVLPESDEWQLSATRVGETEQFLCVAITPEWLDRLSVIPLLPDLQPIANSNLSQIYSRYKKVLGDELINQNLSIAVN